MEWNVKSCWGKTKMFCFLVYIYWIWRQFAWYVKICFLRKNRKNKWICRLLKILPRVLRVNWSISVWTKQCSFYCNTSNDTALRALKTIFSGFSDKIPAFDSFSKHVTSLEACIFFVNILNYTLKLFYIHFIVWHKANEIQQNSKWLEHLQNHGNLF